MTRYLAILLAFAIAFTPSSAAAGKVAKGIAVSVGALAIRHGGKIVLQKSIQRLGPELGRIARACIARQFGPELKGAVTDKVISALVDAYLDEMVTDHGAPPHTREEKQYAQSEFVDKKFETPSLKERKEARKSYENAKQQKGMAADWSSRRDKMPWPERKVVVGPDGDIRSQKAQMHHNKPISIGGSPTNSNNVTPLYPEGHQNGVHKRGSMLDALVSCMKARAK